MPPHLLRCQGIAVGHYSFTLGRLEAGAPSAFANQGRVIKIQCQSPLEADRIFQIPLLMGGNTDRYDAKRNFLSVQS